MATTVTITDVQTSSVQGTAALTATFSADGHEWTQSFDIAAASTKNIKTTSELIAFVKTMLTAHAVTVKDSLAELDASGNWKFTDAVKGLTFTVP